MAPPGSERPLLTQSPKLALIAEVQQKVAEQLQMLQLTYVQQYMLLLQKHEEQEAEVARLFGLLYTEAKESELEGRPPNKEVVQAPLDTQMPWQEPNGLEHIGRELQRLHNHVSRELGRLSQEVVRERVARAHTHEASKTVASVREATRRHQDYPSSDMPALNDAPSSKPYREEQRPASGSQARCGGGYGHDEARPNRDAPASRSGGAASRGGRDDSTSPSPSPKERVTKLSAREEACKTPLEHMFGLFKS